MLWPCVSQYNAVDALQDHVIPTLFKLKTTSLSCIPSTRALSVGKLKWTYSRELFPASPILPHLRGSEQAATHRDHKHLKTAAPAPHFPQHLTQRLALRTHLVTACGINRKFHPDDSGGESCLNEPGQCAERGHCYGRQAVLEATLLPRPTPSSWHPQFYQLASSFSV